MSYTKAEDRVYTYVVNMDSVLEIFSSKKGAALFLGISTSQFYRYAENGYPFYYKGFKIGEISPKK